MCVVLKVHTLKLNIGDWSNGMIGVSKTFGGSSILSSPAPRNAEKPYKSRVFSVFDFPQITKGINQGIKSEKGGTTPDTTYQNQLNLLEILCKGYLFFSYRVKS